MDCFLCLFEILKALTNSSRRILFSSKSFPYRIRDLLSFSAPTFKFCGIFNNKNTTSQVSVDS